MAVSERVICKTYNVLRRFFDRTVIMHMFEGAEMSARYSS
jgi:hypothetical protein